MLFWNDWNNTMDYKSIRQTVHMSQSTETPETIAEHEYRQRLNGWSTF